MYKLFNNRTIIYGVIDLLIQLSLRENENARNGLFCSQLSLRENGIEARATIYRPINSSQLALRENRNMPCA